MLYRNVDIGKAFQRPPNLVLRKHLWELRIHLKAQGADVAWHDPLVTIWEGSKSVDLAWECDVAILATKQPGINLEQLVSRGVQILDCTNSIKNLSGVTSL